MQKAVLKFEIEVPYEIDPRNYPEGSSTSEMLSMDIEAANEDPFLFLESPNTVWKIGGHLLGDPS